MGGIPSLRRLSRSGKQLDPGEEARREESRIRLSSLTKVICLFLIATPLEVPNERSLWIRVAYQPYLPVLPVLVPVLVADEAGLPAFTSTLATHHLPATPCPFVCPGMVSPEYVYSRWPL